MRLMTILGFISVSACRKNRNIPVESSTSISQTDQDNSSVLDERVLAINGLKPVVRIPAGIFTMGCTKEQGSDCKTNEKPEHQVIIKRDFYLMEHEVTQLLYERVMGVNPSGFEGANRPVANVDWYDAVRFCNELSSIEGLDQCYTIEGQDVTWSNTRCNGWRLPTEAEWEYAARGGETFKYAGRDDLDLVAWYAENSAGEVHPVGEKEPNGYGLYDMSGNVSEWVWDWKGHYDSEDKVDLETPKSTRFRMLRGGSWSDDPNSLRVSYRYLYYVDYKDFVVGFRAARSP